VQGLSEEDIDDLVSHVRSFGSQLLVTDQAVATDTPVIVADSPYSLEETVENLRQSIISQNFKLIRTEYLEHGLVDEGKEDKRQVVMHFCNFKFLYEALAIDPRVGMFLPCQVTVTEVEGKVRVMTINPLYLSHLFNNNELDDACQRMTGIYRAIIEDATL
jgi:cytochrome c oxidase cbb3-type subunit 3